MPMPASANQMKRAAAGKCKAEADPEVSEVSSPQR